MSLETLEWSSREFFQTLLKVLRPSGRPASDGQRDTRTTKANSPPSTTARASNLASPTTPGSRGRVCEPYAVLTDPQSQELPTGEELSAASSLLAIEHSPIEKLGMVLQRDEHDRLTAEQCWGLTQFARDVQLEGTHLVSLGQNIEDHVENIWREAKTMTPPDGGESEARDERGGSVTQPSFFSYAPSSKGISRGRSHAEDAAPRCVFRRRLRLLCRNADYRLRRVREERESLLRVGVRSRRCRSRRRNAVGSGGQLTGRGFYDRSAFHSRMLNMSVRLPRPLPTSSSTPPGRSRVSTT